ncbi:MAG: ornithine carbamoyltransferase [Actinocatenispora sp.]
MRSLISLADVPDQVVRDLVGAAQRLASAPEPPQALRGRVIGLYFAHASTRTRTAFSVATLRLGGHLVSYGPHDLQLSTGETWADTGMVLSGMLDLLVVRASGDADDLRTMTSGGRLGVVNAMNTAEHPTQAIGDLATMAQHFGAVDGLHVAYFGEGNSTAAALALALSRFPGVRLDLLTPVGYALPPELVAEADARARCNGGAVRQSYDPTELPEKVDVVYTTQWQTTGTSKADPDWRRLFAPFQVDPALLERWPDAAFMHDLPARRGDEVSTEVIDGARSLVARQAHNKLWGAAAVLEWAAS